MNKSFKQFLIETRYGFNEIPQEEIIELIKTNCQPFLKEVGEPARYGMYRGIKKLPNDAPLEIKVNKERTPVNTDKEMHSIMDNAMHKAFGIKGRSECVLTTGDFETAVMYSNPRRVFAIIPKGSFKYLWSPRIDDMFVEITGGLTMLTDTTRKALIGPYVDGGKYLKIFAEVVGIDYNTKLKNENGVYDALIDLYENDNPRFMMGFTAVMDEFVKEVYKTTDLDSAIVSTNEIMVDCDSYYAIPTDIWDKIKTEL